MDPSIAARFGLLLVRPGMLIMVAPGLGGAHIPAMAKIGITVLLAIGLLPSVSIDPSAASASLTLIIAREAAIGLSLAFVMRVLIAAAEFAGHLGGYQIGFSYGATIDPASGVRHTVLATLYGMVATLAFLAVNGHHQVLRALAASYEALPIGAGSVGESLVGAVRDMLGLVFVVGLRLAAPVVIVILIVEIAVGLISRASPVMDFMVIGYPLRLVVGLFLLGIAIPTVPMVISSLVETALMLGATAAAAFR